MNILLPVDGSAFTRRALEYIVDHPALFGPAHHYTAFTAVGPIPAHGARFLERDTLDGYYRDEADKTLNPVREFAAQHGLPIVVRHAVGHAADAIAAFAKAEKPDLIVMGSHGHSALRSMVLGSVATGLLARCDAPVLLVR
ncbi:MAG TPA: universal stress protein [Burkholderiaceae bacterium]|nr:universal stress protein [Burkholderiaceae bacterium]